MNPVIRVLTIKFHPSTIINRSILKGRDIIPGGNIIIPIDISVLATTISIIIKGIYIKNLFERQFELTYHKCRIKTLLGTSSSASGVSISVIFKNRVESLLRVCLNIKFLIGSIAFSRARSELYHHLDKVVSHFIDIISYGANIKKVKNNASPINT